MAVELNVVLENDTSPFVGSSRAPQYTILTQMFEQNFNHSLEIITLTQICGYSCSLWYYNNIIIITKYRHAAYNSLQANIKFCELKRGNTGIVEKAQGTRLVCPQSIADTAGYHLRIMFCVLCDCKITIKALYYSITCSYI